MAAACTTSEETESLVTCSICLCEYDAEIRKPKFLPCAHTLCLQCLKTYQEFHKDFVITCPLCRKTFTHQGDVTSLPNNPYALHMLTLSDKVSVNTASTKPDLPRKSTPQWCLTCGVMAKGDCQSVHSTVDVTTSTIKNFESLLKLRKDIKKMKEEEQTKLALAVKKRKEIQVHLAQVNQSLKLALGEVKQQEEINNVRLAEMISQMDATRSQEPVQGQDEDHLLMELTSLVDDDDSLDALREKMSKSVESCERKLTIANEMATELANQKKSRISVRVVDCKNQPIPTWELLETGFNTHWPGETSLTSTKRDFLLLSHIVYSIKKRGSNMSQKDEQVEIVQKKPAIISGPVDKFDVNKSIFVITVRRWGSMKGTLDIKLSSGSDSPFIQQLGKMCFRSPKQVSDMIGKAVQGVFVLIPVFEDLGEFRYDELKSFPPARHHTEVGVSLWADEKGEVIGWSFVFPLQHFQHKSNQVHKKSVEPVHFIGHVTRGIDIIDTLSWSTKHQRNGYSFTLESK